MNGSRAGPESALATAARRPVGLVAIAIAAQLLGFAVTLLAARLLGVGGFEAYAVASALFVVLATMAPLGSEKHALRHLPLLLQSGLLGRARGLLRFGATRTLRVAAAAALLTVAWALAALPVTEMRTAILVTCLSLPAGALCHYAVEVLTAANRPGLAMLLFRLLVPAAALPLLGVVLLSGHQLSGPLVVGAWGLGWLLALAALATAFRRAVPPTLWQAPPEQDRPRWRAEARPFLVYRLSMSVLAQAPLLMLGLLGAPGGNIGAYAAAASTAAMITVLATATNRAYGRELGLLIGAGDGPGIARIRQARLRWMLPAVLGLGGFFMLFAGPILSLFQPAFATTGVWPLRLLVMANALSVLLALAPTILKYRAQTSATYAIVASAALLELLLLALLVPLFGVTGATLSYLLAVGGLYGAFWVTAGVPA
ncbi:MAG: hypothetical protein DI568_07000 [Sphingomonas sp.]|nr:MAG: hypothetical protein DI568_07000 [Sphingomonas sp.]